MVEALAQCCFQVLTQLEMKQRLSWLCCGDYGRAAAIWGCLAILSALAFFLLEWFKSQDDPYARGSYEEERYQSDVETKRLCVALKVSAGLIEWIITKMGSYMVLSPAPADDVPGS